MNAKLRIKNLETHRIGQTQHSQTRIHSKCSVSNKMRTPNPQALCPNKTCQWCLSKWPPSKVYSSSQTSRVKPKPNKKLWKRATSLNLRRTTKIWKTLNTPKTWISLRSQGCRSTKGMLITETARLDWPRATQSGTPSSQRACQNQIWCPNIKNHSFLRSKSKNCSNKTQETNSAVSLFRHLV